jgi:hypothetical protein
MEKEGKTRYCMRMVEKETREKESGLCKNKKRGSLKSDQSKLWWSKTTLIYLCTVDYKTD